MKKFIIILVLIHTFSLAFGEKITYQGFLKTNGIPENGVVNITVNIWSTFENDPNDPFVAPDDTISFSNVDVVDGVFTLSLDSPLISYSLGTQWLELVINSNTQSPRQEITFVPYAEYSIVANISEDSVRLNGLLSSAFATATDTANLQTQIDNISTSTSPWADGFGGTQYIGDVVIGDLVASAGDTLQILSEVDESPLRLLVGGVGTRFRVSKNGGTGIGANYSDGQIPDNGLRVKGDVVLEGEGGSASGVSLIVSSPTGVQPFSANVNGNTALQVASNSGVAIGSGQVSAFPPPSNGLRVSGKSTLSDETTINDDLIVKRDAKHSHTDSYGFVKAGIEFSCGNAGTTRLNYFNNINADEITVQNGNAFGLCSIVLPFSFADLYFQTQVELNTVPTKTVIGSCRKTFSGVGGSELVVCDMYDVSNNTNIVVADRVTLLLF